MNILYSLLRPSCVFCNNTLYFNSSVCSACAEEFGRVFANLHLNGPVKVKELPCKLAFPVFSCVVYEEEWKERVVQSKLLASDRQSPIATQFWVNLLSTAVFSLRERSFHFEELACVPGKSNSLHWIENLTSRLPFRQSPQLLCRTRIQKSRRWTRSERLSSQGRFKPHPLSRTSNSSTPILLIDDVAATGSTLAQCAELFEKMGRKTACALVIASSPRVHKS